MNADSKELLETAKHANEILLKIETVFPYTIFPDTITVDREKITIANRSFFRMARINSTQFSDIQSIEAIVEPVFGSLRITSKFFVKNPRVVRFINRQDALRVQRLVQGFIIAKDKDIDLSKISKDELLLMLTDLGQGMTD